MTEIDEETQLLIDSFNSVYQVLGYLGIDPSRLHLNYQFGDSEDDLVSIALPDNEIAIMTNEDDLETEVVLKDEGWKVFRIDSSDVLRFHGIFSHFVDIARADKLRTMSATDKTTSSHEERLLEEILRRGIEPPNRNLKFFKDNGKELTTPDFAWESYRIAFFVDGLWWHVSMDDKERLAVLRDESNEQDLMERNRTRQEKDSENRSILASRGWMILSCTDRDLDKPEGVRAKAGMIAKAMANIDKQRRETSKALGDLGNIGKIEKTASELIDKIDVDKSFDDSRVVFKPGVKPEELVEEKPANKPEQEKEPEKKQEQKFSIDLGDLL